MTVFFKERLETGQRKNYLHNIVSGSGSVHGGNGKDYDKFRADFNKKINAVKKLSDPIKSQWSSPLSMAYHWWKHEGDFGRESVTIAEYFREHANNLFTTENITVQAHNQAGATRTSYMRSFGKRVHVGFTFGSDRIRASHFVKDDTR